MTLRYVPGPEEEKREGPEGRPPAGVPTGAPIGDRRRRVLGEPRRVSYVVWAVVVGTVFPLLIMPMGALPAQIAVMVAIVIVLWIVFGVQGEHRRILEREREMARPRCRVCGQAQDEPEEAGSALGGTRCPECGRVVGRA
mgnify:CR=1 FL=1